MSKNRWKSFINCFHSSNKQSKEELKKNTLILSEKSEFKKLRTMYLNGEFVSSNVIGKKLYDRMRRLSKKYSLHY